MQVRKEGEIRGSKRMREKRRMIVKKKREEERVGRKEEEKKKGRLWKNRGRGEMKKR